MFEGYGSVLKAGIMRDRTSGESLGFAYVLMKNDAEGNEAIQRLSGVALDGRPIDVQEAFPPGARETEEKRFHEIKLTLTMRSQIRPWRRSFSNPFMTGE